ncbi:uncharacterized protein LOC8025354 isoform X2 [Ixodes scapularis]|uniref:uncharacterized protein LOC8025354 isoform X2 n=1 Tax=Ixodes scapularis TaxID=6945 RepID=UPI001A9CF1EF|nr:uncharacterized protein LOC8025354 isoform X2 [Ixodes scapularis]
MSWTQCLTASFFVLLCLCPRVWLLACRSIFSPISGDMPRDFSLKVGDPLVLNCTLTVSKFSLPSLFGGNTTYEVNGSHLALKFNDSYVPQDRLIYGHSSILFRKDSAEYSDTGTYYCNLRVPDRTLHVCATLVTVGEKPSQVEDFKCISYLYRNLTCSWRIPEASVRSNYTLREMFRPIESREGSYRECPTTKELRTPSSCTWNLSDKPLYRKEAPRFHFILTGWNALGSRNWSYTYDHLEILKISEPTEFRRSAVTERSITVDWSPPAEQAENRKLQVSYEIGYLSQYEDEWKEMHILNKTSLMVQGLTPYTNYTFRLRARASRAVMAELWTESVFLVQETLSDVPDSPPRISESGFKVQNYQSKRSITLNFETVPRKHWCGAMLKYLVECCEENPLEDRCENKTSQVPTVTFENLLRNAAYKFRLWSLNENGLSRVHSSMRVDRHDDLMNAPQDIKVMALSSGEYEVSWRPPVTGRVLSGSSPALSSGFEEAEAPSPGYTVFWCPRMLPRSYSCNQSLEWRRLPPNVTATLLQLEPDKVYQFAVAAHGVSNASEMAWTSCVIPVSKELEKITQVSLERDGPHSLLMRWQLECSALKSFVDGYQIEACAVADKYRNMALHDAAGCQYSRYDPQSCKVYNVTNADAEERLLDGLDTNSVYRAVVRALSNGRLTDDSPVQCARTESVGPAISLVIGVAVGGALGLTVLVLVLYLLARWMKKKVDMIKEIKIQLPDGLDSANANQMHSYKNMRNGSVHRGTDANPSPHIPYGRMGCFSAADHAPKKRHDSGHSQGSSSSTDELLYKKTRRTDTPGRNPSGDSSGGSTNGHDSLVSAGTARTSSLCDSGAESDPAAPPSPDCVLPTHNTTPRCRPNLPKLDEDKDRESQDSGLDTAGNAPRALPSAPNDGPSQEPYSKLAVCAAVAETPGLQSQLLASSEPSLLDIPGGSPQRVRTPSAPYSKFGLARSSDEVMLPGPYSVCRSPPPPSAARRREGGPPAMPYSQLALRGGVPPFLGTGGRDLTVGMMLEQPRVLPHIKDISAPVRAAMPPSGYVTVGQAMKVHPADSSSAGPGYSKLGIQPPTKTPPTDSGYVPLHHMVGAPNGCGPYVPPYEGVRPDASYDGESSSDDVAIGAGENSNDASLEDFSFSSTSPPGEPADCLLSGEGRPFPLQTLSPVRAAPGLGYVSAAAVLKCPFDEPSGGNSASTNGYAPAQSAARGPQPADDYVSHNAAIGWGRSASGDSADGSDGSPHPSDGATNGYVSLPVAMDVASPRSVTVGYVPGVKTGSSSARVDCSV